MQLEVKTMAELSEKNITPDFLYWVGSAGSFDDRAKKITRAFVKILNYANVSFGVLGVEESTSGDVAKRAGNEFLFQMQALANIEVMNTYKIKKIITTCPHSFNILKNEYPDLGGNYEVYHHSEFVHGLIEDFLRCIWCSKVPINHYHNIRDWDLLEDGKCIHCLIKEYSAYL